MLNVFTQQKEQTIIPLDFEPYGSLFVVFRKSVSKNQKAKRINDDFLDYRSIMTLENPWDVYFDKNGVGQLQ